MQGTSVKLFLASLVCLGLYLVGMFFPDDWWGVHFLAFVSPIWKYGLLLISLVCLVLPFFINTFPPVSKLKVSWNFVSLAIAIGMGFLFYHFPIYMDNYGDATFVRSTQDEVITNIPAYMKEELGLLTFHPSHCRIFMLGWIYSLGEALQLTYKEVYTYVNLISGVLWVLLWLLMVGKYLKDPIWRICLAVIGITAPFMANFFEHLEVYGPLYVLFLFYLFLLLEYVRSKSNVFLTGLILLQTILLRMHPLAWFFIPALGLAILDKYRANSLVSRLMTWKGVLVGVYIPFLLTTAILYFFITEDYKDDRVIYLTVAGDHIFLPLLSPEAPLDRYNLFSFNHIFDFANMLLFLSIPAWLLLFVARRKAEDSQQLLPLILGLTLLLMISFLFFLNPLLSLPMDWDLFALAGPVLLVLVLLKVRQNQDGSALAFRSLFSVIAISLLTIPFFWVNSNKQAYSERLESIGVRVFKTYYEWSGQQLDFALWLNRDDPKEYLARYEKLTRKLEPHALVGKDIQFAHLLSIHGNAIQQYTGDKEQARLLYRKSQYYSAEHKVNLLRLYKVNMDLKRFIEARENAADLIEMRYPNDAKAMNMLLKANEELETRHK